MADAFGRMRLRQASHDPATVDDGLRYVVAGDVVRFADDRVGSQYVRWFVRAISADRRWVICTRQGRRRTPVTYYTVIDRVTGRRGPDNYRGLGYNSAAEIAEALEMFEAGNAELTVRHDTYLKVHSLGAT